MAEFDDLFGLADGVIPRQFGVVDEPFDAVVEADEGAKCRKCRDFALDDITDVERFGGRRPAIFDELFVTECNAAFVGREHDDFDSIAEADAFGGIVVFPAQVRTVDEPFDAGADVDKCPKIDDLAHDSFVFLTRFEICEDGFSRLT